MTLHGHPRAASSAELLAAKRQAPGYVPPPPTPVSWDAFLAWTDEDTFAEWVDGEILEMPPSNEDHQDTGQFLTTFLLLYIQRHGLGRIFSPPFLMRLPHRPSGREPDLIFVRAEHAERITWTYVNGPADLAVEVVSPDSVTRDYRDKLEEYESAGIPEYWIVDPMRRVARFLQLGADGRYRDVAPDEHGIYTSAVVTGFRLRVEWLWRRPLPTIAQALAELGE